jgi:hypothetical protein
MKKARGVKSHATIPFISHAYLEYEMKKTSRN